MINKVKNILIDINIHMNIYIKMSPLKYYLTYPYYSSKNYILRINSIFTTRFLIILTIINFLLNGILFQTVKWSILPIFKSRNLDAGIVQVYTAIIMSPYTIKPILPL